MMNFPHFIISPSFHARAVVPKGTCIPYPIYFLYIHIPQSDNLLTISYADDFTVSCYNYNVNQMVEALTAHTSNIEKWADERGLAISTPKSAIILFTSQFAQSHPQLTLNNSLYYPLERHYVYWEVTFDPHFKFNDHVKSIVKLRPVSKS